MSSPPDGFVDLRDLLPHARFDLRYRSHNNFVGKPLPGYEGDGVWLDSTVATRVVAAAQALRRDGYELVVYDAYRPHRASRAMAEWALQTDQAWLLDGYLVLDSRHCRGTAIDIGLWHQGALVDMGSDFDEFGEVGHTLSATGPALDNRLRLRAAMLDAGLGDYALEWWHFDAPELDRPLRDLPYSS